MAMMNEGDWKAQHDASILKEAAAISNDPKRKSAADNALQQEVARANQVLGAKAGQEGFKGNVTIGENGLPKFG
jgi:hypothetical protein